jgi:hypothetical protein
MTARTKRRSDWGPLWVAWWCLWALILGWPLLLGPAGIVIEVFWLGLALFTWKGPAWLRRRRARRRPSVIPDEPPGR